jgi:hypothetical protein
MLIRTVNHVNHAVRPSMVDPTPLKTMPTNMSSLNLKTVSPTIVAGHATQLFRAGVRTHHQLHVDCRESP